ncbi:MAG: hypothetical protein CVV47_02690 [Spirochaetae bacterium HGW-Spirochaetae-3]|jgi:hypothetical protein|nr:MAG: hypothetical protein CVV47_02690 [Spirochaetae bacterium HGW-Spirochaetae-3]
MLASSYLRPSSRLVAILCIAARSAAAASAAPASDYVDPSAAARLVAGQDLRASSSGKDATLSIAPIHPAVAEMRSALVEEGPGIVVEALFLWPRPRKTDSAAEILAAYNVLRAIGSLQGIEYYSASKGKMRTLYEISSLIAGPDDPTPALDERLVGLPAIEETLYARQKDTSFGDNRYRITLSSGPGFVRQSSTNITRMSIGIVPVAAQEAVNVRLLVVSVDEGLLFYVASSAKVSILPGLRDRLEASFVNRAAAAFAWFTRGMEAARPEPSR